MTFSLQESDSLSADTIIRALRDELAFCVFRSVITKKVCTEVTSRFEASPLVRDRGDGVPGRVLGTFHYLKDAETYLRESTDAITQLRCFFADDANPLDSIFSELAQSLKLSNIELRQGRSGHSSFCPAVIRSWEGAGSFRLLPHEDMAQLAYRPHDAMEFLHATPTVCNINVCVENFTADPNEGAVRIWNYRPTHEDRLTFGTEVTGYPYPEDVLNQYAYVQVPIFPGDVYVINGSYVHAVLGGASGSRRLTIAAMLASVSQETVIYWS